MKNLKHRLKTNFLRLYMLGTTVVLLGGGLVTYAAVAPQGARSDRSNVIHVQDARLRYPVKSKSQNTARTKPISASTAQPQNEPQTAPAPTVTPSQTSTKPVAPTAVVQAAPAGKPAAPAADPDIASETQCPGQASIAATATVLTCMTSFARQTHGLSAVAANDQLMTSAANKAQDIKDCGFSHTACNRDFGYWITSSGYASKCYAENIAMGQRTPGEVFVSWMNSAGHRANILHGSYRDLGVAQQDSTNGPIWVMHLGGC